MFTHYLKIAFRNLFKYKTQTVVSILGLAVGFTAFSFTLSWIRYEMSYDSHNPDRDRIFRVVRVDSTQIEHISSFVPDPLAQYLPMAYPEIEAATFVKANTGLFLVNDGKDSIGDVKFLMTDCSFFRVFYPEIKLSFPDPMPDLPEKVYAYSASFNKKISKYKTEKSVNFLGIVPDRDFHSNVPYEQIQFIKQPSPNDTNCPWCAARSGALYIRLHKNADINKLSEKLKSMEVESEDRTLYFTFNVFPLKEARYKVPDTKANIKFAHLKIFAIVSLLVIFCGLFNYIMLFVNRIKLRSRELALRKISASTNVQLIVLLITEFLIVLLLSLLIGGILTEWLFPQFLKLSQIDAPKSFFIIEAVFYSIGIVICSILAVIVPAFYFMKRSVRENIQPETKSFGGIKNIFTLSSLFVQLVVGVLMIFCTLVFLTQLYFLNNTDIGLNRKNVATVAGLPIAKSELKSLPNIENAIHFSQEFLPKRSSATVSITSDEGTPDEQTHNYELYRVDGADFLDFFEIKLIKGRNLHLYETNACLINETASKILGGEAAIGKKLEREIVGIIPDLKTNSPLLSVQPAIYIAWDEQTTKNFSNYFAYRFAEGKRYETEQALQNIIDNYGQNKYPVQFLYMDDEFSNYTKSERYLFILLSIMTAVAILIAVFGIYSIITLACSQRRKEIAIRKVNGARVREIFILFFKEYFLATIIACIVAFPVGYLIMQRWLEQYVRRISIEFWMFASVLVLIIVVVFLSIFFRVWKAANENPAEVVKAE